MILTDWQIDDTYRVTDRQTDRTDRQTDRQTDRWDWLIDWVTDKQANTWVKQLSMKSVHNYVNTHL